MSSNPAITIGVSAVDTASQILDQVDRKVMASAATIEAEGQKTISTSQRIAESFKANWQAIATSTAALGASIVSFSTSFDVLQRTELNADRASFQLHKSQEALEKLQKSGTATAQELADAQEKVRQATEKANLTQGAANDTYANFLANVPAQMISFGTGAAAIMNLLGDSTTLAAVKTGILSAVNYVLGTSFGTTTATATAYTGALASMGTTQAGSTATTTALTAALQGQSVASMLAAGAIGVLRGALTLLAAHPIILVLTGIVTLVTLLIYNIGGLRDMFVNAGKAVLDFLDAHLKPLGDGIRWLVGLFSPLTNGIIDAANGTKAYAETSDQAGDSVAATGAKVQTYTDYLAQLTSETNKAVEQNFFYIQSHDELLARTLSSADGINQVAEYMRQQATDADNARAANFAYIASHYDIQTALALSDEQLAGFADALQRQEQAQKDAEDAAKDEADAQRRATDEIRDRIDANVDLAKSMGVTIDLSKTTVDETDRIADHLRDLQSDYEDSRKRVEDFAIAHGVNVVDAVKASDTELLSMIDTLGGVDSKTAETRKRLVDDFTASKDAVADYATQTGTNTQLASDYFKQNTDNVAKLALQQRNELSALVRSYEDLASAARDARDAERSVSSGGSSSSSGGSSSSSSSSSNNAGLGGFGKGSSKNPFGFASGGIIDEFIYGVGASGKTYTFGENGKKEAIIPLENFSKGTPLLNDTTNNAINKAFYNIDNRTNAAAKTDTKTGNVSLSNYYSISNVTNNNIIERTLDRIIERMNTYFSKTSERSIISNNVRDQTQEQTQDNWHAGDFDREVHIHVELDKKEVAHAVANITYDLHRDISKRRMRATMQTPARFS